MDVGDSIYKFTGPLKKSLLHSWTIRGRFCRDIEHFSKMLLA